MWDLFSIQDVPAILLRTLQAWRPSVLIYSIGEEAEAWGAWGGCQRSHPARGMHQLPIAAGTNYYKLGGFKQQKVILSLF